MALRVGRGNCPTPQKRDWGLERENELLTMVHNQWRLDSNSQFFHFWGVHSPISHLVLLHPVNCACLSDHKREEGPTSEVYTHLNCSIKPHETSSNPEKLTPDTFTARSRYTNQMDTGLESISHHQAAIRMQALLMGRAQSPTLCSVRRHPGVGLEGTYFLSCICL